MLSEAGIKSSIRSAPGSGKKVIELKDEGGRGEGRLALIIRITDARLTTEWYAVWWRDEKRRLAKLGVYPAMGLSDARKVFREDYAPIISTGGNPAGPRARRERKGVTISDMVAAYVKSLKAAGKPSWTSAERVLNHLAKDVGEKRRAADVTAEEIRDHLAEIYGRGSPAMARETRAYIGAAFAYVMKARNSYTSAVGLVDFGIKHNPVAAIPVDSEASKPRDRNLKPAELRAFWEWLLTQDHVSHAAPALRLIITTGQRVTEILRVSDQTYDRAEMMLDWSKTKNGMPHAIPLPPQGAVILDALIPNQHGLYFAHRFKPEEAPRADACDKLVRRYVRVSKCEYFTPRDLRRTWKTLTGAAGISKETRDRLQNHARSDVSSRHYDRYDYLPEKRAAMEVWSAYLDRILKGELDNPVAQLNVGAAA